MKKLLPILFAVLLIPQVASAQWEYAGPFPPTEPFTASMHGIAVDAEGKVWITPFGPTEPFIDANGDTLFTTPAIYVYNPDGTEADFSPIQTITVGGVTDTLGRQTANNRGLGSDHNGNILHATNNGILWRLNHETGEGMNKVVVQPTSLTAPKVDAAGNIFTALVLNATGPLRIFDENFNFLENAIDTTVGFSRDFGVTADGNTIYWGGFTNNAIWKYTRPDEFSPFNQVPDTLFRGITAESFARNPKTGYVWMSQSQVGPDQETYPGSSWFAIDPATDQIVDSFTWNKDAGFDAEKPRGIAFSPDGDVAYVVMFDATSGAPSVQKFVRGEGTGIERDSEGVPSNFALDQNYPNPFNPTTEIKFSLKTAGHATLKVYDTLGREVAVLVDRPMTAGTFSVDFDGSDLASGTYLYMLDVDGQRMSRTMVLLK